MSKDRRDKRLRTAALIQSKGLHLAIDTGPDFRLQMLNHKVEKLDAILMTHYHNDHIAGLDDIRPFNFKQKSAMKIFADTPTAEVLERKYDYIFDTDPYPGSPRVDLIEHDFNSFTLDHLEIQPIQVMHGNLPISAYRIGDIVYVTDANAVSQEELELMKGCSILVVNALRREEHHSHFNLKEAISFSKDVGARDTYLLHISHHLGLHAEVEKELPEHVHLAFDGLSLNG